MSYDVEVTDYSTGQTTGKTVTATSLPVTLTADHQFGFRIRAWQPAPAGGQFDREYSAFTEDVRVWVDAAPPVPAVALSAGAVDLGTEVLVSAQATTDGVASPSTSGVDMGEDATFDWSWGDGSPTEHGVDSSHVYERAGTYLGRLTVRDRAGNSAEAPFQVTVRPQARIQGLAPLGLTRLRVPGRLVARRAGIVDVRASRCGPPRRHDQQTSPRPRSRAGAPLPRRRAGRAQSDPVRGTAARQLPAVGRLTRTRNVRAHHRRSGAPGLTSRGGAASGPGSYGRPQPFPQDAVVVPRRSAGVEGSMAGGRTRGREHREPPVQPGQGPPIRWAEPHFRGVPPGPCRPYVLYRTPPGWIRPCPSDRTTFQTCARTSRPCLPSARPRRGRRREHRAPAGHRRPGRGSRDVGRAVPRGLVATARDRCRRCRGAGLLLDPGRATVPRGSAGEGPRRRVADRDTAPRRGDRPRGPGARDRRGAPGHHHHTPPGGTAHSRDARCRARTCRPRITRCHCHGRAPAGRAG